MFSPNQIKCGVSGGALTRVASGFGAESVTAINTGVTLEDFRGTGQVTPAVGDLIVAFGSTAGSYNASVSVLYHGERSV